jgi:redox-sensitive bicupin YhaK (pirin superfamily)
MKKASNGIFAMAVEGEFDVAGTALSHRDAIGIWETDTIAITARSENARILLIEVPMYEL